MNDGCNSILFATITVVAVVMMIIISVAGVHSWGFGGIFAGPIVVLLVWLVFSWIYSN